MGRGCSTAPPKPPPRSSRLSMTSYLTTTSPHTSSASVRTSSTSALPCRCLFLTKTAQRLCAFGERKPATAALRPPTLTVVFPKSFTPTGVNPSLAERHRGNRPARPDFAVARSARQTRQEVEVPEICDCIAHPDRG